MIRRLVFALLLLSSACSIFTDFDAFTSATGDAGGDAAPGADGAGSPEAATCAPGQDFSADPKNCGACGHDCLGGACLQSACQPFLLTTEVSSAHIRLDATHAYFADDTRHVIARVPKRGGPVEVLASDEPFLYEFGIDDAYVYYQTKDAVRRVRKTGGAPETVAPSPHVGIIVPTPSRLFWSDYGEKAGTARIHQASSNGSDAKVVVDGRAGIETLALDGARLFYGENGIDGTPGTIRVIDLENGQDNVVAEHLCRRLVLDSENVYFLDYVSPNVWKVPRTGGTATAIATAPQKVEDADLALDGDTLYWGASAAGGGLYRVDKTGGPVTTIATMNGVAGVAVDEAAIYWSVENQPQIYVRAK